MAYWSTWSLLVRSALIGFPLKPVPSRISRAASEASIRRTSCIQTAVDN